MKRLGDRIGLLEKRAAAALPRPPNHAASDAWFRSFQERIAKLKKRGSIDQMDDRGLLDLLREMDACTRVPTTTNGTVLERIVIRMLVERLATLRGFGLTHNEARDLVERSCRPGPWSRSEVILAELSSFGRPQPSGASTKKRMEKEIAANG